MEEVYFMSKNSIVRAKAGKERRISIPSKGLLQTQRHIKEVSKTQALYSHYFDDLNIAISSLGKNTKPLKKNKSA